MVGDKPLFFRINGSWAGLSWAEADQKIRQLAAVLVAGVSPGDRVIISAEIGRNGPFVIWLLCLLVQLWCLPIPPTPKTIIISLWTIRALLLPSPRRCTSHANHAGGHPRTTTAAITIDPTAISLPDGNIETKQWNDAVGLLNHSPPLTNALTRKRPMIPVV